MLFDKRYYNIYFVGAVLVACFLFMIASTGLIMGDISNKTSADLAVEKMQKACDKKHGTLVTKNENLPLQSYCTIDHSKE